MCLLVLAWQVHPRFRLVVAANRDEYHERPAAALGKWPQAPGILGGRDLRAGGAWLALDRARRFGVVTNFRELQAAQAGAPSRGSLIPAYLAGAAPPREFFRQLEPAAGSYSGFNLLLADHGSLWYGSNRAQPFARELPPGVYGLSNELLDTPWPKLTRVKQHFRQWLEEGQSTAAGLFALLGDRTQAPPSHTLPPGGLPPEWERILSAPFVAHPQYGTRCSTVMLLGGADELYLAERRFDAAGVASGDSEYQLNAGDWP
ncbi:MAG TPA: NRDE family protein [Steroidobacteraceae bacterium]|nr:NRDE family protein [Steroidobacteraceae bacterium]